MAATVAARTIRAIMVVIRVVMAATAGIVAAGAVAADVAAGVVVVGAEGIRGLFRAFSSLRVSLKKGP